MKRYIPSKERIIQLWSRKLRMARLGQNESGSFKFPSNSQPWVENPKTIKDLLYIADQVTRLSEIYGPDGIIQKNPGMKITEAIALYDKTRAESKSKSAVKEAEDYGFDISLIDENLRKTPEQRIRDINSHLNGIEQMRKSISSK